jgi:hypothetical protein
MKKNAIFQLILCLILPSVLSAQEYKNFDLNTYYTPDIKRSTLGINGSGNGEFSSQMLNTNNRKFQSGLGSSFTNYLNTRKQIREISAYFNFNGSNNVDNNLISEIRSKTTNFNNLIGINADYNFYNTKNRFILVKGAASSQFANSAAKSYDSIQKINSFNSTNFNNHVFVQIGFGCGRIENVSDAQHALFLIKDLSNKDILNRYLSSNEINELSKTMTKIKNKRFLDSRLKLIDEINTIDSFFVQNGFINKSNAKFLTTLYDNWLYGNSYLREAGQKIELTGSYYLSTFNSSIEKHNTFSTVENIKSNNDDNYQNILINLRYLSEKPFQQRWQHSFYSSAGYNFNQNNLLYKNLIDNTNITNALKYQGIKIESKYKLGYYPTTRTHLYASACQTFDYITHRNSSYNTLYSEPLISNTEFQMAANYYVSPNVRLNASANLTNTLTIYDIFKNPNTYNSINGNFAIALIYFIF